MEGSTSKALVTLGIASSFIVPSAFKREKLRQLVIQKKVLLKSYDN